VRYDPNDEADKAAYDAVMTLDFGVKVVVVGGRKIPRGTTGRVFWTGDKGYGPSVGFEDSKGGSHFTSVKNVEVVPPPHVRPGEWPLYLNSITTIVRHDVAKGDIVRIKGEPAKVGKVFYRSGDRLGFKDSGLLAEVYWANLRQVEVAVEDRWEAVTVRGKPFPTVIARRDFWSAHPAPFNKVAFFREDGGSFLALDENFSVIARVPQLQGVE
jgi:hypothetical protein